MSRRYLGGFISASLNPLLQPSAPTIGTATAGNAQASVAFTASTTGSPTSYTVISSPGNIIATGTSSPITITGLSNFISYTFTVVANNQYGPSASSAVSNAVMPVPPLSLDYLVVAGGGTGGHNHGGGGGGGGVREVSSVSLTEGVQYTVTVGAGGAAKTSTGPGNNGSNSSFNSVTATGGGGGGSQNDQANGNSGGCGGGGASTTSGAGSGGSRTSITPVAGETRSVQGFAGANSSYAEPDWTGAGGGGAGQAGSTQTTSNIGGKGGDGYLTSISGVATYYGGGGGGGGGFFSSATPGAGGLGGGTAGSSNYNSSGSAAANTGGGTGGTRTVVTQAGAGGSGVVIINANRPAASTTGSPVQTVVSNRYIYQFNSSGSITF